MKIEQSNIIIGKSYPASVILEKMQENHNVDISFGHILVEYETEKRHKYFINKDFVRKLKNIPIKIYTIIPTISCKNFAHKLLAQKDVLEILEDVKENHKICCVVSEEELIHAGYNGKSKSKAITLVNTALKSNRMEFKASSHDKGIKISYKKLKEEELKT